MTMPAGTLLGTAQAVGRIVKQVASLFAGYLVVISFVGGAFLLTRAFPVLAGVLGKDVTIAVYVVFVGAVLSRIITVVVAVIVRYVLRFSTLFGVIASGVLLATVVFPSLAQVV